MTTAPNSLMPRAHIITAPPSTPRHASGRVTLPECLPVAGSVGERYSFPIPHPPLQKLPRLKLTRNGRLTKSMATTIPARLSVNVIPNGESH